MLSGKDSRGPTSLLPAARTRLFPALEQNTDPEPPTRAEQSTCPHCLQPHTSLQSGADLALKGRGKVLALAWALEALPG